MADIQTGVNMKTTTLTYSHKELQFMIFHAVVEGLRSAELTGRGLFISYQSQDSDFELQLWKAASAAELGNGKLLHSYKVNKGDYQMNDIRLGVMVKHIAQHCEKFVEEITPLLMQYGHRADDQEQIRHLQ